MIVSELIHLLQQQDPNDSIMVVYDGLPRMIPCKVWKSAEGQTLIADDEMVIYNTEDRPVYAPSTEQEAFWDTSRIDS